MPEGAIVVFSRARRRAGRARGGRAARLQHHRRDLPAGDQGAQGGARGSPSEDYDILLIGHEGHEEVVGTAGEAPDHITLVDGPEDVDAVEVRDPDRVVWLSQTTLSVDETMETVAGCASASRSCRTRRATTSATPPRTARSRSSRSPPRPTW